MGVVRKLYRVRGQVQGVGFRPFVFQLATELGLSGSVHNDSHGVVIEAQGPPELIDRFEGRLAADVPPLARIDTIESHIVATKQADRFRIRASQTSARPSAAITPDASTCQACITELFDTDDRRYRYPFINCTHCGPRYTIARALPYDRANTSMAVFTMCPACQREYEDPENRRFHAQPNACFDCGPQLRLTQLSSIVASQPSTADVVAQTVTLLKSGAIVAIKGLGGYHLACDARNSNAVAALRRRKNREEKPFAVMVANRQSFAPFAACNETAAQLLTSTPAPIVLLPKREQCDQLLPLVAPGLGELGAMLPYTPLHYLLFHDARGRPAGLKWLTEAHPWVLVMTSANPGGEPLVIDDTEARRRLDGIADAVLSFDREICFRCDDSVLRAGRDRSSSQRVAESTSTFIRRARGFTPRALSLPEAGRSVLACGGWFKNTVCLTRDREAYLSQHLGDLDNAPTCQAFEQTVRHLLGILELRPAMVAHDLHPDFFSTRFAHAFADEHGLVTVGVQHHHAHAAAVMAEHGLTGRTLAVTLDGVGIGSDGGIWGGELLDVDSASFARVGHLRPMALPGGDRAAREPWRMAASALFALGRGDEIPRRFQGPSGPAIHQMLLSGANCPMSSSAGRLFDAAAGLLGIREQNAFEAQAAMLLEGLAQAHGPVDALDAFEITLQGELDLLQLLDALADEPDPGRGAALFHATLIEALTQWVLAARRQHGPLPVVLSGGCFVNRRLANGLCRRLREHGADVYMACQAPPNDGGLSLGQAWVAMQSK